jgi:small subunit ribosomal protein S9
MKRAKKRVTKKKEKPEKKARVVVTRGKRKSSIARAYVSEGKGVIRINRIPVDAIQNRYIRNVVMEPILLAGEKAKGLNVVVNVRGGGVMGQAEAARTAIARGIVEFTGDAELKEKMQERDRFMLLEDVRRVEPKKYKGPKARARFQKSYR